MLPLDPQAQNSAPVPQGLGPVGLGPVGQVRIYLGSAHRFIWPVHLAGWLELGWTTEPGARSAVTTAPRKKRASTSPIEANSSGANPANESPVGANPVGASSSAANPVGDSSATADEPLPVLVTDFLVDPSVPTDA